MIELNKVYNENCLKTMLRMPDEFVDLTVTSPPYDNLRKYNGYSFDFDSIAKELYRVTKKGGVVVWVVGDATINGSETGTSFKQALYFKEIGFNLHDTMIYRKKNPIPSTSNRYRQCFEYMFILSKGVVKTFNPLKVEKKRFDVGKQRQQDGRLKEMNCSQIKERLSDNIFEYGVGGLKIEHPAVFPEQLAYDHIYSWSNEGDIVYDCFGGSGTTAKMADKLNRNWILSEISSEYCEIIRQRLYGDNQLKLIA